jgi:hypothetical protein
MAMAGEVDLSVVAAGEIASQSPASPLSVFLRCCCTWRMSLLYLSSHETPVFYRFKKSSMRQA